MNYQGTYDYIINRSKTRVLTNIYVEHHHIVPKCIGGTNDKENITRLTAKEHFICHILLAKIYPYEPGLLYAIHLMRTGAESSGDKRRYISGLKYEKLRIAHSKAVSNQMKGNDHAVGNILTKEHCEVISRANIGNQHALGTKWSDEAVKNLVENHHNVQFATGTHPSQRNEVRRLEWLKSVESGHNLTYEDRQYLGNTEVTALIKTIHNMLKAYNIPGIRIDRVSRGVYHVIKTLDYDPNCKLPWQ